jgi:ferredoxin
MESDIVVCVPKFKTHGLTQVTGAIKNMFGILVGGEKGRMHAITGGYRNFSELLVDIYQIRPPDLVIMDAIVGMEGNGPTGGDPRRINKIIVSNDGVAVDAAMVAMMGRKPNRIHTLKIAAQRGVGEINVSKMEIVGEFGVIDNFRMPSTFLCHFAGRMANNPLFHIFMERKPAVLEDVCKGCNICVESCPVGAMSATDKIPVINRKMCIQCYCCQELCPNNAIELRRFAPRSGRG